jgi:hypothetical protein
MESGFVIDFRHGSREPAEWVEGAPVRSFWMGTNIRGKLRLMVESWRCPSCGLLKSYATKPVRGTKT